MKKMKIELRPCPFCAGKAEVRQFANPKNFYSVQCPMCKCGTDGFYTNTVKGTDEENIKANATIWNMRVD